MGHKTELPIIFMFWEWEQVFQELSNDNDISPLPPSVQTQFLLVACLLGRKRCRSNCEAFSSLVIQKYVFRNESQKSSWQRVGIMQMCSLHNETIVHKNYIIRIPEYLQTFIGNSCAQFTSTCLANTTVCP